MPDPKKPTILQRLGLASKSLAEKDQKLANAEAELKRVTDLCAANGITISTQTPSGAAASTPAPAAEPTAPSAEGATSPEAETAADGGDDGADEPPAAPAAPSAAATPPAATSTTTDMVASLQSSLTAEQTAHAATKKSLTEAQATIQKLTAEAKTAEARATEILAEAGISAEALPAATSGDGKSTEGLTGRDRFEAATKEAHPEIFQRN